MWFCKMLQRSLYIGSSGIPMYSVSSYGMPVTLNKTKLLLLPPHPQFSFLGLLHVQAFIPGRNLSLKRGSDFGMSFQSPHPGKKFPFDIDCLVLIFIWHLAKPGAYGIHLQKQLLFSAMGSRRSSAYKR